jgi:gamma-glutamylcyclotransferase (GGCT)/AIG2-like uncharacterized protein YtfP
MPLLFSYGTLQQAEVQLTTFGRRLEGERDELVGFAPASVKIADPRVAATLGRTHHANVIFNGNEESRVPGMVFEITDPELASADAYESVYCYLRIDVILASGKKAWVYVCFSAP